MREWNHILFIAVFITIYLQEDYVTLNSDEKNVLTWTHTQTITCFRCARHSSVIICGITLILEQSG